MSLLAKPVSQLDLENLQLGIIRTSNPAEALAVSQLINADSTTVFAYANTLLEQAARSSEVTDAVISAATGLTPSATLLTNVVLNFLPTQIAFAQHLGLDQTIYAAETVAFTLLKADTTFIAHFGTLAFPNTLGGDQLAAQAMVNATFGTAATSNLNNVAQIWLSNWKAFYTANAAAFGFTTPDQIDNAARAATFGDLAGTAVETGLGPLQNIAASVLEGDGLFLNGEGPQVLSTLGHSVNEPGDVPLNPFLQGSPFQVFTLTVGTDGPLGFQGHGNGDQFNAPLSGAFLDEPTLTDFDNISDTGINAALNAVFDGSHTAAEVTIDGIPTWNIQNHANSGTVEIFGGPGNTIRGLKTLNYNANGGSANLEIGTPALPIVPAQGSSFDGFIINVANALGTGHVDIAMQSSGFAAGDAITVQAQGVGTGTAGNNGHLPAPPPENQAYDIAAGSPTNGFTTWHVQSLGLNNNIGLGADGSHSATTVFLTDGGSGTTTTLWAASASATGSGAGDWSNVTTLDAHGTTGTVFITGAEDGTEGFLSANNAITNLIGGSGAGLYDLSSRTGNGNGVSINGGGNAGTIVELNSDYINAVSGAGGGFALWTGVPTLADLEGSGHLGGLIDLAKFPGTNKVILADSDSDPNPSQSANFLIKNAPSTLTFDFQNTDQNGHNVEFNALPGGNLLTVQYDGLTDSSGQFASINFNNVLIQVAGASEQNFYSGGVLVEANVGDPSPMVLTFDTSRNINIAGEDTTPTGTNPIGTSTLTLVGGNALHPTTGTLNFTGSGLSEIGVTNASTINSTGTGILDMEAPGNAILFVNDATGHNYTGIFVSVDAGGSFLQGSLGPVTDLSLAGNVNFFHHEFAGVVGSDSITDDGGGTNFFGDGGPDAVNLDLSGGNHVWFGAIGIDEDTHIGQIITDTQDFGFAGFWNKTTTTGSAISATTSADLSTIAGFNAATDTLNFNSWAWAGGDSTAGSLVHANGGGIAAGNAVTELVTFHGQTLAATTDFVLYGILPGQLANAADLVTALTTLNVGDIKLGVAPHEHMLFAYIATGGDLKIADVDFLNGLGAGGTTAGRSIVASDIANLGTGVTLLGLGTHAASLHFDNIG